jgi:Tol biopolymer transport system component
LSTRDGSTALWTVAIRDGQPAAEPVRVKDGMQDALNLLGWTTRGLAYLDRQRSEDIYTVSVDPASGEPIGRPQQIPYGRTGRNAAPVWSPDGRFLAFGSYSPAEPDRRVVVVLPTGGGEAREFPIPTNQWPISGDGPNELRWFGESRGLGFQGLDARGDRTLFRLTLATGEWNTFPLPGTQPRMEWNADGSRVFYYTQGDRAIVERDLQSDKERIVLRGDESGWSGSRGLRFSPDRRLLALSDGQALKVLDVESRQSRLVHKEAQAEVGLGVPSWSRDGRALLVERTESRGTNGQSTELRLIPIDGGQVRRIPLGPEVTRLLSSGRGTPRPTLRNVVWSPDGSRLAFVLQARQHETWVIENPLAATGAAEATVRK